MSDSHTIQVASPTEQGDGALIADSPMSPEAGAVVPLGSPVASPTPDKAAAVAPAPVTTPGWQDDSNTLGSVSTSDLQAIANRFRPRVWLASDETYRPVDPVTYFHTVDLMYDPVGNKSLGDYIIVKAKPTVTEDDLNVDALWSLLDAYKTSHPTDGRLANLTKTTMVPDRFHMQVTDKAQQEGVPWSDVNRVPMWCRVRRYSDHYEIVYAFMWSFNGPFTVCCRSIGAHSGDMEHITVRTNADATKTEWVYFGSHGEADGVWRKAEDVELLPADMTYPTRPVVYAADHSHGIYPAAGTWWRICGFANDHVSGPNAAQTNYWDPPVSTVAPVLMFDPKGDPRWGNEVGSRWLTYPGTLGEDGTDQPRNNGFWIFETEWTNNCFRRCCWPCRYLPCACCYNSCQCKAEFARNPPPAQNMQ